MKFELVKVEVNAIDSSCFDLHIKQIKSGVIMIADQCKIWDEDQGALRDMFNAVKNGEW